MAPARSLAAIAYAEAPTLSAALALIAKRRNDLDAALRAGELTPAPVATRGAATDRALLALDRIA